VSHFIIKGCNSEEIFHIDKFIKDIENYLIYKSYIYGTMPEGIENEFFPETMPKSIKKVLKKS
jgi:hypothetical protein